MSAPLAPLIHRATEEEAVPAVEGLGLAGLVQLLPESGWAPEDDGAPPVRVLVRDLSLRAAAWGAGPQGAWRAW